MKLFENTGNPGMPIRWRGPVPFAPDVAADAAAPKPAAPAPAAQPPASTPAAPAAPAEAQRPGPTIAAAVAAPAPAPAPQSSGKVSEVDEALARVRAREQELAEEAVAYRTRREQDQAVERRAYVRALPGLSVDFADEDLDRILPVADVRTDKGKAAIAEWRKGGGARYFAAPVDAPVFDEAKWNLDLVGGEANANRRLFNARHAAGFIQEKRSW